MLTEFLRLTSLHESVQTALVLAFLHGVLDDPVRFILTGDFHSTELNDRIQL